MAITAYNISTAYGTWQAYGTVCRASDGKLYAVGAQNDVAPVALPVFVSTDNGATWSLSTTVAPATTETYVGNVGICAHPTNGTVLIAWQSHRLTVPNNIYPSTWTVLGQHGSWGAAVKVTEDWVTTPDSSNLFNIVVDSTGTFHVFIARTAQGALQMWEYIYGGATVVIGTRNVSSTFGNIAIDDADTQLVVWLDSGQLVYSRKTSGGAWTAKANVGFSTPNSIGLCAGGKSGAFLIWNASQARLYTVAGGLGSIEALPTGTGHGLALGYSAAALDDQGIWRILGMGASSSRVLLTRSVGGVWTETHADVGGTTNGSGCSMLHAILPATSYHNNGWEGVSANGTTDYDYLSEYTIQDEIMLEMAFGQTIMPSSPVWTDVSSYLLNLKTKRGRMHDLDRVEAGTAVFTLNNVTGNWWRYNTASPFYVAAGVEVVKPLTLVRLTKTYNGTNYRRYYGVIEDVKHYTIDMEGAGQVPVVDIVCVDHFKSLARCVLAALTGVVGDHQNVTPLAENVMSGAFDIVLDTTVGLFAGQAITIVDDLTSEVRLISSINTATNTVTVSVALTYTHMKVDGARVKKFPAEYSGQRVQDILCELGWPIALTSIDAGQVWVTELVPPPGGIKGMEHLFDVAEAESGLIFQRGDGVIEFQDRDARLVSPLNTSQATFVDDGSDYVKPEFADEDSLIYNEARITGDAVAESFYDAVAQILQGQRALPRPNSIIAYPGDAFDQAYMIVRRYSDSLLRARGLTILPVVDKPNLYPSVLGFELSTRITLQLETVNPAMVDRDYHIEGVEEDWSAADDIWRTRWQLWDVNQYRLFNATHSGHIVASSQVSYATVHAAATGTPSNDVGFSVGQRWTSVPVWGIWRGALVFDTSTIGAGATILSAEIVLVTGGWTGTLTNAYGFDLTIVPPDSVSQPLVAADYGNLLGEVTDWGHLAIPVGVLLPGLKLVITLNATGLANINKTGTTTLALRSSRDISNTAPTPGGDVKNEFVACLHDATTSTVPKLIVRLQ